MTVVIMIREIDVSIGSSAAVIAAFLGLAISPTHMGLPLGVTVLLTLAVGAGLGAINGFVVGFFKVPSIIATLAALAILKGAALAMMGGKWVTDLTPEIRQLGTGSVVGIPIPILTATIVCMLTFFYLYATPQGLRIHALGSNPSALANRGISTCWITFFAFVGVGVATAVACLISVPQLSVVESGFGAGWELFIITCVVVGGVSVQGGKGTVVGVLLGVVLLGIIRTVLIYLKLGEQATYWERSIQGAFILGAALLDGIANQKKQSKVSS